MMNKVGSVFYQRSPEKVAKELLGKVFVKRDKELIITETEAYLGPEDLASHARFGPTDRTRIMWYEGGLVYVYLIYGMYELTNIVTGPKDVPGAVLLRAGTVPSTGEKVTGPGKFSQYLGITRGDKGQNLIDSPALHIEDREIHLKRTVSTPRIGVDYAGMWAKKKLRFVAEI
jgi:DNA-3-methyladenine glycosylase